MSELQKPVEEIQAAAPETPAKNVDNIATETPAADAPEVRADASPVPAAEANVMTKEDQKVTKEANLTSEGVLGYKGPGLVK